MCKFRISARRDRRACSGMSRASVLAGAVVAAVAVVTVSPRAEMASGAALPRFVDADGLEALKQSLIARQLAKAAAMGGLPSYFGDRASPEMMATGFGHDAVAGPRGEGGGDDPTTADFHTALTGARRDAGEMRALTDKLKQSADEISQGLTVTGAIGGTYSAATSTSHPEPAGAGSVTSTTPAHAAAAVAAAHDDVEGDASLSLPPEMATDDAGAAPTEAGAPRRRHAGERKEQASPNAARKPRSRQAAGTDHKPAVAAKAKVAAQATPAPAAAQAPPLVQPQPLPEAPKSGGLFSWLKPFAPPRELSAFGWANNE